MTSADTNAVQLMLLLLEQQLWQEDLPRLLNGTLARQRHGAWDLTVANAWGALAVEKFSQAFEETPIGGTTTASLESVVRRVTWADTPQGNGFVFPWPETGTTLTVDHARSRAPLGDAGSSGGYSAAGIVGEWVSADQIVHIRRCLNR